MDHRAGQTREHYNPVGLGLTREQLVFLLAFSFCVIVYSTFRFCDTLCSNLQPFSHEDIISDRAISPRDHVDINTADAAGIESLPGIGPRLAARIVRYRSENGGFLKKEDLLEVAGIGPKKFDNIRDMIVAGAWTPEEK